ncbi:centromere protein V [Echria macrotheca]|uniref:Centromere protein V n=1 Tax=Echria macrotheca TaxID=438768 RepID=A0AAJ0BAY2_9PEZI|nr:centromere protein V [Echria macrotheca]
MAELKTYRGNCHCGAFVYEVDVPEIKSVGQCSCSICSKKAYLWIYPHRQSFRVLKGDEDALTSYTVTGQFLHKFCSNCGTALLCSAPGFPPERQLALNVRAIQGIVPWDLERRPVDGASYGAQYEAPKYTGPGPTAEIENAKMYYGSCHCGAVRVALRSLPLDKDYPEQVVECNCSICSINGCIWIYPRVDQLDYQGRENLATYRFGNRHLQKTFCKTCGVSFANEAAELTQEEFDALPSDRTRDWHQRFKANCGFNIRVLNDYDFTSIKEPWRNTRGQDMEPRYVYPSL